QVRRHLSVAVPEILHRAALSCLLLAGCDSDSTLVVSDLSAAHDLAVASDLAATVDAGDLSMVAPDDLSFVQPADLSDGGSVLAPAADTAPTDGITCDTSEQLLSHIHAHLQMFVKGQEELVAAGIGIGPPLQIFGGIVIGGSCFSWLHTHDESGIIHIE